MKNPSPNLWVTHYGRAGVIDNVNEDGYAVVRFSNSPYPFPDRQVVRASELKKHTGKKPSINDYEPAPF